MAGAVDVIVKGAIEAGERGGGSAPSRFSGYSGYGRSQGRGMGPCGFSQGEGGGRGATTIGSREKVSPLVRWRYIRQALNAPPS